MNGKIIRFVIYGLLGMCFEVTLTALVARFWGNDPQWSLRGKTYLWMFFIYGLISPFYEPIHNGLRKRLWLLRAATYGLGFLIVEYITGWLLVQLTGHCPWNYGHGKWCVHGLIRLDFGPMWAGLGLLLEPTHDFLVRLTPAIQKELGLTEKKDPPT